MIHTIRTVAVGDQESKIDSPIILYRGDREVEVEFTINGSKFTFTNGGNVIKSTNATHGQLVINTPTGENMFSEVTECHDGKVVFVITKEMIDELIEVGFYSFQIRLFDESQVSRVTIPPVLKGIDIRNPIAAEDETNVVDIGLVDYAVIVKDEFEDLSTFLPDGNYNKTEWESKDVISVAKLNKIEDALYNINSNMEASDLSLLNQIDRVNIDISSRVNKLSGEVRELSGELGENVEGLNNNIERVRADLENDIKKQLEPIAQQNVVDYYELVRDDDWSDAIQAAIDAVVDKGVVMLPQSCKIRKTIKVNKQVTFIGNGHSKIICDYSEWGGHNFGSSVPQNTALYIEAREPVWLSEIDDLNIRIGGFFLEAINITDSTYGMYLGYSDISKSQGVLVNYSVSGKSFDNISIKGFNVGMQLSEVWNCTFENLIVLDNTTYGVLIEGQSVNNFFKNCRIFRSGTALQVTGREYPDKYKRPEGNIFDGGFYGESEVGIYHRDGLFCNYTNLVVDLNNSYAMRISNGDSVCVANCYLYGHGEYTVKLEPIHTTDNNLSTSFSDNTFVGTPDNQYAIGNGDNWSGLTIKGNSFQAYTRSTCIFLGYNNRCIISNNVFKNNDIPHCIQHTITTEISEFNNVSYDGDLMFTSIDGSEASTKINTNINMNGYSINDGTSSMRFNNNSLDITNISQIKVDGRNIFAPRQIYDCNDLSLASGFILVLGHEGTNAPRIGGIWVGMHLAFDSNFIYQELHTTDGSTARRFYHGGVWSEWRISLD